MIFYYIINILLVTKMAITKLNHYTNTCKNEILCKSLNAETKRMNSFIETDELLEKFNGVWNKVSNSIKEELNCEPISSKILR